MTALQKLGWGLETMVRVQQISKSHTGTVLFFHGSGDTGEGVHQWIKDITGKNDMSFDHLQVLYPTAPLRRYTPFDGQPSHVWFDRIDISPTVPEHRESLELMCHNVKDFIMQEIVYEGRDGGVPLNRLILGGFSMGGALALHLGYRYLPQVAGIFSLSSFLNENTQVYDICKNRESAPTPRLFMCHGDNDNLVPTEWGRTTFQKLSELNVSGEFHVFPNTMHEMKPDEITKLSQWINQTLPPEV